MCVGFGGGSGGDEHIPPMATQAEEARPDQAEGCGQRRLGRREARAGTNDDAAERSGVGGGGGGGQHREGRASGEGRRPEGTQPAVEMTTGSALRCWWIS